MMENSLLAAMPFGDILKEVVNNFEGLVIADEEGRFVYVSQKWTQLTGRTLEEVYGVPVRDITPDSRVDTVLRSGLPMSGEVVRVHSKEGGDVPMISYYTPIYVQDELVGCATVCASQGMSDILEVSGKVSDMLDTLSFYQEELSRIQGARYSIGNIIGSSPAMKRLKSTVRRCARSTSTVIIQGETGTGKELVAHAIHSLSPRSSRPFVKINCAAIPENLIESELFGYVAGAFTGASKNGKKGKFQLADGGTLFLDEINSMPSAVQSKLLRAIQEREVEPIGGSYSVPVDVRIITASNQDLEKLVKAGNFREDLYYRLNVIPITVPPLRERKEDIPAIAEDALTILNRQLGMAVPGISEEAKHLLMQYDWPGNVRELRNVIERAMNDAWMEVLTCKHFEPYMHVRANRLQAAAVTASAGDTLSAPQPSRILTLHEAKEEAEQNAIRAALEATGNNKAQAAKLLGITRAMLYRKLEKSE